jgi:hypothetical protein
MILFKMPKRNVIKEIYIVAALEFWYAYFLPIAIGILSVFHCKKYWLVYLKVELARTAGSDKVIDYKKRLNIYYYHVI